MNSLQYELGEIWTPGMCTEVKIVFYRNRNANTTQTNHDSGAALVLACLDSLLIFVFDGYFYETKGLICIVLDRNV